MEAPVDRIAADVPAAQPEAQSKPVPECPSCGHTEFLTTDKGHIHGAGQKICTACKSMWHVTDLIGERLLALQKHFSRVHPDTANL